MQIYSVTHKHIQYCDADILSNTHNTYSTVMQIYSVTHTNTYSTVMQIYSVTHTNTYSTVMQIYSVTHTQTHTVL